MAPVPRNKATYEDLMAVPDPLVAEILGGRVLKMPIYLREGIEDLWIVDPVLETLEILRRGAAEWIVASTHAGKDSVRAAPFGAVELHLSRWWIGSA